MERRLLAFSTLGLAQPTESANAEKEVLMKWVTVLGSRMGEIYMQVVHTRSYLPLVPLGVRESDLAILATWPNHVWSISNQGTLLLYRNY
jgi:hypothetical protein